MPMIWRQIQILFQLSLSKISAEALHSLLLKSSLDHHEYFFSHLILSAASTSLHHARKLFDNSPIVPPPLFAWNTLIKAYSKTSSAQIHSVKLFLELLRTSDVLKPDKFTYPFVIKACGHCLMLRVGESVHSMVFKAGFASDLHVNNTLLTMYGGCGAVEFSRRLFDEMCERDVVSWSSMIAAYVDCKSFEIYRTGSGNIVVWRMYTLNKISVYEKLNFDMSCKRLVHSDCSLDEQSVPLATLYSIKLSPNAGGCY
ncbi:UNVERIFIED_CONTAM: Pentatricopeptide repeat-containing protein, chloroplastic/mitochondrial [Sesamum indicum]